VKGLHGLSSQELHKLLRDSENFTIHYLKEKKSMTKVRWCISISISIIVAFVINTNPVITILFLCQILNYILFQIDMEKLAGFLPLHLIAVLMSSDRDEALFRYLLSGIRLLHSLCDLAPRHVKLEQVCIKLHAKFCLILFLLY
jgi:hypothetical protein